MSSRTLPLSEGEPEGVIPHKVLIFNFSNLTLKAEVDYLAESIAEALIGPLQKTGRFEIMSRSLITSVEEEEVPTKEKKNLSEAQMLALGKEHGADIVLTGKYSEVADRLMIIAHALEVESGRIKVSENVHTGLDSTLFEKIDQLAQNMATKMVEELPPLTKQMVVYVERDNDLFFVPKDFTFRGVFASTFTWGFENKYLAAGFGGLFNTNFQFLHRLVQPYFSTSFTFTGGKTQVEKMSQFDFAGGLSYGFVIPQSWRLIREIQLRPFVAGGVAFGTIWARTEIGYTVPTLALGAITDFFIYEKWIASLMLQQQFLFESDTTLKLFSIHVGVGYRL